MASSLNCVSKKNLAQAYDVLLTVLSSDRFLLKQGLNGDIPFHICPYEPSIQGDVTQMVRQLKNDLKGKGVSLLEINLYDLVVDTLQLEGDWEWLLENETTMTRDRLKEELQGILDVETVIMPAISQQMQSAEFQVLIVTGVGEVFPYIRSHNILNNLQKRAKDKPTVMFFPGSYQHSLATGAALVLFGELQDDKYYRAFNILDRAT